MMRGKENGLIAVHKDTSLSRAERLAAFKAAKAAKAANTTKGIKGGRRTSGTGKSRRTSLGNKNINSKNVRAPKQGAKKSSSAKASAPKATDTAAAPRRSEAAPRQRPGTVEKLKKKMAHFANLFESGTPRAARKSSLVTSSSRRTTSEAAPARMSIGAPSSAQKAMRGAQKDLDLQLSVGKSRRMQMMDRMKLRQSQRKDQQTRARTARQFQRELQLSRSVHKAKTAARVEERCSNFVAAVETASGLAQQGSKDTRAKALAKFNAVINDEYYDDAQQKAAYWIAQGRFHGILGDGKAIDQLLAKATPILASEPTELAVLKGSFDIIRNTVAKAAAKKLESAKKAHKKNTVDKIAKAVEPEGQETSEESATDTVPANGEAVADADDEQVDDDITSHTMPVKKLHFFEEEDSLPAIQVVEEEDDDVDDGAAEQAKQLLQATRSPAFARRMQGGAVRQPVASSQPLNRRLSGGARRVSRRLSAGPTLANVSLFDEAEESVLDSTDYTGYSLEADEDNFSVEELEDGTESRFGKSPQRAVRILQTVEENATNHEVIPKTDDVNEVQHADDKVSEDDQADLQRQAQLQEKLIAIPPSYTLVQEKFRCTPSQKKQFQSNSYVSAVRRSLRKEKPQERDLKDLLMESNWSYVPNKSLERLDHVSDVECTTKGVQRLREEYLECHLEHDVLKSMIP